MWSACPVPLSSVCEGEVLRFPLLKPLNFIHLRNGNTKRLNSKENILKRRGNKAEGHYFLPLVSFKCLPLIPIEKWHIRDHTCTQSFVTVI